jgi:hypothetical protein
VALGRIKLHIGDERGADEVAQIARVMLATTVPVVRKLAAWYLAVHAMAAGDPAQAHCWLCALGETERLSLFPLRSRVELTRIAAGRELAVPR